MVLKLTDTVIDFLQSNPEQKFTARDIADWIFAEHPDECRKKKNRSQVIESDSALVQQIAAEIGARRPFLQKKEEKIKFTEGRPRKYYFTLKSDTQEILDADRTEIRNSSSAGIVKTAELELYPRLSDFLRTELNVYSMRIDEKTSSNSRRSGGNKWLHPDVVGVENLTENWHPEIKDCVKQYADKKTRLWSSIKLSVFSCLRV